MKRRFPILTALGLCVCLSAFAAVWPCASVHAASEGGSRAVAVDPTGQREGYSAVLYDNSNGLPTSETNAIAETPDGFLWFGSYSGLIRYDGSTFERIDSTTGIASVVSLFVDSKERLWVGTNDSGVAVMEKGKYTFFTKSDGLPASSIRSIVESEDGTIYVATTNGVVMFDGSLRMKKIRDDKLNDEYVRVLRLGGDGLVYGVTNSGAVFTLRDGKLASFYEHDVFGVDNVRAILPDAANPGHVYLGTTGTLLYYGTFDADGFFYADQSYSVEPLNYINSIDAVGDGVWIGADNGICVLKNGVVSVLDNLPVQSSVEGVTVDYQGDLWVASSKQGVMKIVPNQFSDIFQRYDLPEEVVNTTCMVGDKLFIGGKSTGLTVIDRDGRVDSLPLTRAVTASGRNLGARDLIDLLQGCRIRSIIRDSQGNVWIATYGENALLRYRDGEVTRFGEEDGLPSDRVRTVAERQDGSMLVACSGGLGVIEEDKVTAVYNEQNGVANTEILTVTESFDGDILVGTDGGGIYLIKDDLALHIGTESGLSSEVVMRIRKDKVRRLYWLVTSNSIAYMDQNYTVTSVKQFPYSNNFDLYQNSKDEMWILSSNGIYVSPVETLVKNETVDPEYYGRDNGLSCIVTANSYSELTQDGDLYISGTTGVAKVNIEKPFTGGTEVRLSVPCVEADGQTLFVDGNGRVTVPASTRKMTIYGYVFNYSLANPEVTYQLKGFDKVPTTVRRSDFSTVDYTNLNGGDYDFVMQTEDGGELTVHIVKKKALYELLWFRVAAAAAAVLLVVLLVSAYVAKKTRDFRKKEKRQKQLIREIVEAFAKVIDMKDAYTNGHSTRVADYTVKLARELGYDEETIEKFYNIALLHDIGKVGIPPEVLNKPGKLTDEEFAIIKSHPALGYETLKGVSIMPELAIGAGSHHERPDGKGYPEGLRGNKIPRVAQIIAVADTFDAMYSDRPYRKRMNFEKAVSIIKSVRGTQLTADVVDAFLRLVDKGEFRAPDDFGEGTTEDIDNIHKKFDEQEKKKG